MKFMKLHKPTEIPPSRYVIKLMNVHNCTSLNTDMKFRVPEYEFSCASIRSWKLGPNHFTYVPT